MRVALNEILAPSKGVEDVVGSRTYPTAGMLNRGRGLFGKGDLRGHETSYKKLTKLSTGQLVYSKLFAWEGAIAVVPAAFDGAFVSPEFPAFDLDESRLLPGYMAHVARWGEFQVDVAGGRSGLGLRRQRVSPSALLEVRIPLPDINEQRRIAAHLDLVHQNAERLSLFRQRGEVRTDALFASLASQPQLTDAERRSRGWSMSPLGCVMAPASTSVSVDVAREYPNLGILSFGRGVFRKPPIEGHKTSATNLNRVSAGQFIYSRLFAFEGAYAYVPDECDGYFVSNEFPAFDVDPELARAEFIAAALRDPRQWQALASSSKGLGLRRQRIQVDSLLRHELWFPPIDEQTRVVEGVRRVDNVRGLLEASSTLGAALLPSALNRAFAGLA